MSKKVSVEIDIESKELEKWVAGYLGEEGVNMIRTLQMSFKNIRKESFDCMIEEDMFPAAKHKLEADSEGNVSVLFESEEEKTFAILKYS